MGDRYRFYVGERVRINESVPFKNVTGEIVRRYRSHAGTVHWYSVLLDEPVIGTEAERTFSFVEGSISHA